MAHADSNNEKNEGRKSRWTVPVRRQSGLETLEFHKTWFWLYLNFPYIEACH